MSNLLIDDRPIMFLPMLAKALGSCERAIVLQQIHWLSRLPNSGVWDDDGLHWVWGSYEEWCRDYFPMWKPQNLAKHIRRLEKDGVLFSAELNAKRHDHTKHYRINYEHEWLQPILYGSIVSGRDSGTPSNNTTSTSSYKEQKTSSKTPQKKEERPPRAQSRNSYRPPADVDPLTH